MIALRQAGLEPVVASMGTALTERQLRELSRLDAAGLPLLRRDAAGEEATLRGMELAVAQGFEVRVVALPKGKDPADDPAGFEARLAERRAVRRAPRPARARPRARQAARVPARPGRPERASRSRPSGTTRGGSRTTGSASPCSCARPGSAATGAAASPRLIDAGDRLEREALAGVRRAPGARRRCSPS